MHYVKTEGRGTSGDTSPDAESCATAVPDTILTYLVHTSGKIPNRAMARAQGRHASTLLRQIRRVETRRDDPLVDAALEAVDRDLFPVDPSNADTTKDYAGMVAKAARRLEESSDTVDKEARRILRRLCEKAAFLAVAPDMEKSVVLRETVPGRHTRIAVVDARVAHEFALRDWISCQQSGKVARYSITQAGRGALKRLLETDRARKSGGEPARDPFQAQHQEFGERRVAATGGSGGEVVRFNLAESPLLVLGRKKDRAGQPYLSPELIEAGERLREDFECAQMGPRVAQNWDRFLAGGGDAPRGSKGPLEGPAAARDRLSRAMTALGPGLSDVVLRVCCLLEGLEAAERRLGWSARSGKVVLKIALQRLAAHYDIKPRGYHSRELG